MYWYMYMHLKNWKFAVLLFIRLLSSDSKALTTIPDSPSLGLGNKRWSTCSVGSNSIDTTSDSPETPENYDEVCGEADTYHQWGQLIGNWSDAQRKKPKIVRDMVRRGVPNALRGMVWQLLCEARDFPLRDQYPQLIKVILEFQVTLELYVHHTDEFTTTITIVMVCFICSSVHMYVPLDFFCTVIKSDRTVTVVHNADNVVICLCM